MSVWKCSILKVNYTTWGLGNSGGVRVILDFAREIAKRGHDVTITTLTNRALRDEYKKLRVLSPDRHFLHKYLVHGCTRLGFLPYTTLLLSAVTPDCDINVATFCFTAYAVQRSRKGVPFYHMQHYEPLFFSGRIPQARAEATYVLPMHRISNSTWLRREVYRRYGTNSTLIHPGIDTTTFSPREVRTVSKIRRVVCLGKSVRWKGLPELFTALEWVRRSLPNLELVMFGNEPGINAPVPNRYIVNPSDDQLANLYSSADAVVTPSWYESFPLPPLEAMACGAPVVATRYGTEDYAFDGVNSLVVSPRDVSSLAHSLLKILTDEKLRRQLSAEGIRTAQNFKWERTAPIMEGLFKAALQ